jgi:hypothetical protein
VRGETLKLIPYSTDGGVPHLGYIEDGETYPLDGSNMLE